MPYKVLIIDDEQPARELLREFLGNFPELELHAECADGFEGLRSIKELKPDIVFLDIQMPRINGIEMLELIDEQMMPQVIFTTAFDEYAIKAFELNAADYLLKPISVQRFNKAVLKVIGDLGSHANRHKERMRQLLAGGLQEGRPIDRIVVSVGSGIEMISDGDIYYIQANDDYVLICTERKEFLKKKTLQYYEMRLDANLFARVHRSYIVNVDYIQRIEASSKDAWMAILKNGNKIAVSKQGYALLRKAFDF